MEIIYRHPNKKYSIQRYSKSLCSVVKVLKDYDNEKEAINDLAKLASGLISEEELINSSKPE